MRGATKGAHGPTLQLLLVWHRRQTAVSLNTPGSRAGIEFLKNPNVYTLFKDEIDVFRKACKSESVNRLFEGFISVDNLTSTKNDGKRKHAVEDVNHQNYYLEIFRKN